MKDNDLLLLHICGVAECKFLSMKNSYHWTPAKHPCDSKATPTQFGAHTAQVGQLSTECLLAICSNRSPMLEHPQISKVDASTVKKMAIYCTQLPQTKERQMRPRRQLWWWCWWKTVSMWLQLDNSSPAPSKPKSKTLCKKLFHWCAKCGCWFTTRGMTEHHGKDKSDARTVPTANLTQAGNWLLPDPPAWMFYIPCSNPLFFNLSHLAPLLPMLCLLSYLFNA